MSLASGLAYSCYLNRVLQDQLSRIKEYSGSKSKQIEYLLSYKDKAKFLDDHIAFVVSNNTDVYHTYDCQHRKNAKSFWAYNTEAAEYKGYRPCKVCH